MKKLLLFASVVALLASCTSKPKFELEVNIHNNNSLMDKILFVTQKIDGVDVYKDSIKIKNDFFSMKLPYKGPALINISIPESNMNEIMLVAEEGKIQLIIDDVKPQLGGTPINDRLQAFLQQSDSVSLLFKQLDEDFEAQSKVGPITKQMNDDYRQKKSGLLKENTERIIVFIKENVDNPIGEYYFMTHYITFPLERKLELNNFATPKLKEAFGVK